MNPKFKYKPTLITKPLFKYKPNPNINSKPKQNGTK